jgi:hypothetical protein
MRTLILSVILGTVLAIPATASDPEPAVSLILSKASAAKSGQDILFRCEVILENEMGRDLSVRSNFSSACDGLELIVTDKKGKTLIQRPYIYHQSPFGSDPHGARKFAVKEGATEARLVFPISELPANPKVVKVRLVGTLPGSGYERILSTDTIEVQIKDR